MDYRMLRVKTGVKRLLPNARLDERSEPVFLEGKKRTRLRGWIWKIMVGKN